MARPLIDISILGDKALSKKLARLGGVQQKAVVRSALGKSMTRIKKAVVAAAPVRAGNVTGGQSPAPGTLKRALKATKINRRTKRFGVSVAWPMPERHLLGIDPGDKYYYPAHVEYGHGGVPPNPYIRGTVNAMEAAEFRKIGADIGKGIEKKAAKR